MVGPSCVFLSSCRWLSSICTTFNLFSVFLSHSEGLEVVRPKEGPAHSSVSAFASESMQDQETLIQEAAEPTIEVASFFSVCSMPATELSSRDAKKNKKDVTPFFWGQDINPASPSPGSMFFLDLTP